VIRKMRKFDRLFLLLIRSAWYMSERLACLHTRRFC
jgi:hypothetical protein